MESQLFSQRATYARAFINAFRERFAEHEQQMDHFSISVEEFDQWLYREKFATDPQTEDKKSPEWKAFVQDRNTIRLEMNKAASVGKHGEPPFSVDKGIKGFYDVKLLLAIAMFKPEELAQSLLSLAHTKSKKHQQIQKFLMESPDLPSHLRIRILNTNRMWRNALSLSATALNQYIEALHEDYEEVLLELDKQANAVGVKPPELKQLVLIN